jgi:hypothetical protein
MRIFTHDRIKTVTSGVLSKPGLLWGLNALQNISIGRHTPLNPQQAVGYLGIVDYTSGVVTSDVTLDCVLVEGCNPVDTSGSKNTSAYRYAATNVDIANESYVLTSAAVQFTAGSPATFNVGYLTNGLASYLDIQAQPDPETGEESRYAVVMGDDGSGIILVPTWKNVASTPFAGGTIPIITAAGARGTVTDGGIPAGVQQLGFNSSINRDQILDFRTSQPCAFVTTYPVEITANMELYELPVAAIDGGEDPDTAGLKQGDVGFDPSAFRHALWDLRTLAVQVPATSLAKHEGATTANPPLNQGAIATLAAANKCYVKAIGMRKTDEQEGVQVGRYLTFTVNFTCADLLLPLAALS